MSGAKRRSGYRKTVSQDAIYSYPEPTEHEYIAQVTGMLGSNLFSVCVVSPKLCAKDADEATVVGDKPTLRHGIAVLPTRFKNAVWVRRGGFLIVGDESVETSSTTSTSSLASPEKSRFRVEHILFPEQIKHLRSRGMWPAEFESTRASNDITSYEREGYDDDDEEEDEDDTDDEEVDSRRRRPQHHVPRNRPGDLPVSEYDNESIEENHDNDDVKDAVEEKEQTIKRPNRNLHLPELIIRQLADDEVDDAYALLVECGIWLDKTYGLKHWSPPYKKEVMESHAREHFLFSVTTISDKGDERLVGTFTVGTMCWIPYFADVPVDTWRDREGIPMYLGKLAVSPSEHNRGIGKALMKKVDEIAKEKGCSSIRFDAIEKVPGLRQFYEGVGYNVMGKVSAKDAKGAMNELLLFEKVLL